MSISSKYLSTRRLSSQHSEGSESVSDELELLVNVYLEDMEVQKETERTVLTFHVKPSTADDEDKQFVWLDLQFLLKKGYPHSKPDVAFLQSRGLSDAHLRSIQEGLSHLSGEKLGTPMLFDLVEHAKGCLTDNNKPCGHCAVCQFTMEEDDVFVRTPCYHYFHQSCMAHYISFFRQEKVRNVATQQATKKLECPVCREPLPGDDTCVVGMENISLATGDPDDFQFEISEELRAWQAKMAAMFRRQCEKGGTIVPAQEVVIDNTWVSIRPAKEEPHYIAHSNREDNRPYSDDGRQARKDPGVQGQVQRNPEMHRSQEGSRDSLNSEQQGQSSQGRLEQQGQSSQGRLEQQGQSSQGRLEQQGQSSHRRLEQQGQSSQGSNPGRLHCPPGFHDLHTGHKDSSRSFRHGDDSHRSWDHHSDRGHSSGGSEGDKGHSGGGQRSRGGTSRHGYRHHGRNRGDREAGGSHGDREHGRQGVHKYAANPVARDSRQYNEEHEGAEPNLRQVSNHRDKAHFRELYEVGGTQEKGGVGHSVTRHSVEPRDPAKPRLHDSRRARYPHRPKNADGARGGGMADVSIAVLPCARTSEQSESQ